MCVSNLSHQTKKIVQICSQSCAIEKKKEIIEEKQLIVNLRSSA